MKNYKLGALYGDGIGPEIVKSTVDIMEAAAGKIGIEVEFEKMPLGWEGIEKYNNPVPDVTKEGLTKCDAWLLGPHDSAAYPEEWSSQLNPSGTIRHHFDLYSNARPIKPVPGIKSVVDGMDLVLFRENTEGFMPDRNMFKGRGEFLVTPEIALATGVFTKKATRRIAHEAFKMAMSRRKKLAIVHKANVIQMAYGLFRDTCYEVGREFYPEVEIEDYHIDAMTAHLVRRAKDFDVIVTTNLFGDILSDLAGELSGSLGLAPAINSNETQAMAQAAHGSAPDIGGQNVANPVGMILSGTLLLKWLADKHEDKRMNDMALLIEAAIEKNLTEGVCTRDLGGKESTTSFTQEVINTLKTM
ncbi:isocitrate/isopropylmalate dehydrogenase family protein [Ilyobacter polytropus]|uniref:3-isopropylmalate dehydrogenase n=1 Tax=Ilyobacter polytropus (strain ATCC 51220 / DSM 2926 / LMG 16218 / CuHBu1) TaxID=572544 RepID=E3HBU9_ILYPC|nr:isocitrate/isopropylmalate dehydrogenase family protein [Ilyobacter polytropus]ADO83861.1 3-isopropylmalate dehydrogenase [Ilyobacter polytropus DSM 2926]